MNWKVLEKLEATQNYFQILHYSKTLGIDFYINVKVYGVLMNKWPKYFYSKVRKFKIKTIYPQFFNRRIYYSTMFEWLSS